MLLFTPWHCSYPTDRIPYSPQTDLHRAFIFLCGSHNDLGHPAGSMRCDFFPKTWCVCRHRNCNCKCRMCGNGKRFCKCSISTDGSRCKTPAMTSGAFFELCRDCGFVNGKSVKKGDIDVIWHKVRDLK